MHGAYGVAGVSDDRRPVTQSFRAIDDDRQAVGLMPGRRLRVNRDDHPCGGVDRRTCAR